MLRTRKSLLSALLALAFSIVIVSVGTSFSIPVVTQSNSTATVYLDPPTISATVINQTFTVNVNISNATDIYSWQTGMIFNATVLNCTGFFEGEFLSSTGPTWPIEGTINNTLGVIEPYGWTLLGDYKASGSGRLAYFTFKVKTPGVSDLHLRDVKSYDWIETSPGEWDQINVPLNLIDVYTVFLDTTPHTVVTVSNSTSVDTIFVGTELVTLHSGFYDHAFSMSDKEIRFNVTGPYAGWSNVTIPKTLLSVDSLDEWRVVIDGNPLSVEGRIITQNATHYSLYLTYDYGVHEVRITTRGIGSSTISINLSSTSIDLGSSVTISGEIDPERINVAVTIIFKPSDGTWATVGTNQTDSNSRYSYSWTPDTAGTYELKASWAGDLNTEGDESDAKTLEVKEEPGFDPYLIAAAAAAVILVAVAVVYYFVKIRKPEEEE